MKYDFYARTPQERRTRIISAQQVLFKRILRDLTFTSAVEIGPGFGGFAHYCRARGVDYFAAEENEQLAMDLRGEGFSIIKDALNESPLKKSSDLLFMSHVIEHFPSWQDATSNLKGVCARHLTDGGHIVLLFPDVSWSPRSFYYDYTHSFPTTLISVERMCEDLGFKTIRKGHYIGRWIYCWRFMHLLYYCLPKMLLGDSIRSRMEFTFAVHGFLVVRYMPTN